MPSQTFKPFTTDEIRSFTEIIDHLAPDTIDGLEILPLCHTTNQGSASGILTQRKTSPRECKVFNEKLVYFFYGKASYLIEKELANYTDNPPITFIYDQSTIKSHLKEILVKRILPFDSGGFTRYDLDDGFDRDRYTYCETSIQKVIGFIRLLYKTHLQYLEDEININELNLYKEFCLEIEQIINMYDKAYKGKIESGQQVYSIELQYASAIELLPTHIVIPYNYYTSPFWGKKVVNTFRNVQVVHYGEEEMLSKAGRALKAEEYQTLMHKKVNEIVRASVNNLQ